MIETALILFVIFQVRHAIVIAYLHRDLAHHSVTYSAGLAQFTRLLQWLAAYKHYNVRDNYSWAHTHLMHHKHSDTDADPYYPITEHKQPPITYVYTETVTTTRLDDFFEQYPYGAYLLFAVSVYFAGWPGAVFAILVALQGPWRMIFANHAYHTWFGWVNDNGRPRDNSRNLYYGFWFFLGEELHANHHKWPGRSNFGIRLWEIDLTYYLLRLLSAFGLVINFKSSHYFSNLQMHNMQLNYVPHK